MDDKTDGQMDGGWTDRWVGGRKEEQKEEERNNSWTTGLMA